MSITALRSAVTTAAGTPTQWTHVGLLRELITAWRGTPTRWSVAGLLKEAIVAAGGTPTQVEQLSLLRELVTALTGTPVSYDADVLWAQVATVANIPVSGAPANTVLPVVTGALRTGNVLSTTDGTWTNTPTSFAYQWFRGATAIGTNASTYTLVSADEGANITCRVAATNATGTGFSTSAAVGPILPLAPANSVVPAITGTASQGSTLTVSNGTWANTPTSYAYQWKRGTTAVGTNSSTYTLVSGDVGANITCDVTGTNAGGSATATSNTVGPVSATGGLSAITLTQTTAAGTNPPEWDSDFTGYISWDGSANGDKHLMRWRRSSGAGWTTEVEQGLDDELLTGGFTWPLLEAAKPLAGGYFEAQEQRARYVAGVETLRSAWSNSVVDNNIAGASTPQPPTDATVKAWWSVFDIGHLWKDTAGTAPVTADGDAVARIDDQSGSGRHLLQTTSGLRPLYKTTVSLASSVTTSGSPTVTVGSTVGLTAGADYGITGTGIPASTYISAIVDATHITLSANATAGGTATLTATVKPYLLFDGTDDYMASAAFTAESQPFYQGHAVTPSSIATTRQIFNGGDTTHKMGLSMNTAGNTWATDCGTVANSYAKPMTTNPAVICALMQGGGTSFVRLNGSQSSTGFETGTQQVNGYTLGSNPSHSQNWIGKWSGGFVRSGTPSSQLKTDYDTWLTALNP